MWGWRKVHGCGLVLTHPIRVYISRYTSPSTTFAFHNLRGNHITRFVMASSGKAQKWTALNVRDTFLEFFKKNGHTFGRYLQTRCFSK